MQSRKHILITGGLGFIGSVSAAYLLEEGFQVSILTRSLRGKEKIVERLWQLSERKKNKFAAIECDLLDKQSLFKLMLSTPYDVVLHLAGAKGVTNSVANPILFYESNVSATINLLAAMKPTACDKIIFGSSYSVYGASEIPNTEESETNPQSPYARTKLCVENLLKDVGMKVVVLRYSNPIGADLAHGIFSVSPVEVDGLVPTLLRIIRKCQSKFFVYGSDYNTVDGTAVRDYVDVRDVANLHIKVINRLLHAQVPHSMYEMYNVGSGRSYSILQILKTLESINGGSAIEKKCKAGREGDAGDLSINITKCANIFNFRPTFTLHNMIESLFSAANFESINDPLTNK